jgi:outer membrane protein W
MRNGIIAAVSLLFVITPVFAQQARSNSVSVFVSDFRVTVDSHATSFESVFGAGFGHMFTDRISGELSVSSQSVRRDVFFANGVPTTGTRTDRLLPIDAIASYHFFTNSRWKPYLGVGARYVHDSFREFDSFGQRRLTIHTVDPEVAAGVSYQFNPTWGIRFDVKQILDSQVRAVPDSQFKASVGLGFHF